MDMMWGRYGLSCVFYILCLTCFGSDNVGSLKGLPWCFGSWASIVWGPERSVGLSYPPGLAFGPGMANQDISIWTLVWSWVSHFDWTSRSICLVKWFYQFWAIKIRSGLSCGLASFFILRTWA